VSRVKNLNKLLPFVAIGTIADCQSVLHGTNRTLVKSGLQIMQSLNFQNDGLLELIKQTGTIEKITAGYRLTSQDLGFVFSPILNASGRVSHAKLSISTLLARGVNAGTLATELIAANQERKEIVKGILTEVDTMAKDQIVAGSSVIWLEGTWSKGIVGLIASRLVSQYNVPVIVVSLDEDHASGSLRAPEGYHLPNAMSEADAYFEKYGGHPCAAGFSTSTEKLPQAKSIMEIALASQKLSVLNEKGDLSKSAPDSIDINSLPEKFLSLVSDPRALWVTDNTITTEFLSEIWLLDPFGQDFPFPWLIFSTDISKVRFMGDKGQHFKLTLNSGVSVTAFNQDTELLDVLRDALDVRVWIQAKLSQNSWNGKTNQELIADKIGIYIH
jgi:single-stranded-DNA-specific exonuclease